jgi:hypothetical protein
MRSDGINREIAMPENLRSAEERATQQALRAGHAALANVESKPARKPQKARAPPDDDLAGLLSASVPDVARMTGWGKDRIYRDLREGHLRGYLHGSRRYILIDSVRRRIAELAAEELRLLRSPQPRRRV